MKHVKIRDNACLHACRPIGDVLDDSSALSVLSV